LGVLGHRASGTRPGGRLSAVRYERFETHVLVRADSGDDLLPAWARLGPLSTQAPVRAPIAQTVARGCVRRERSPNGVAWRFPDWSAVGFRCPQVLSHPRAACLERSMGRQSWQHNSPHGASCADRRSLRTRRTRTSVASAAAFPGPVPRIERPSPSALPNCAPHSREHAAQVPDRYRSARTPWARRVA
jgi:hypothetical protein